MGNNITISPLLFATERTISLNDEVSHTRFMDNSSAVVDQLYMRLMSESDQTIEDALKQILAIITDAQSAPSL